MANIDYSIFWQEAMRQIEEEFTSKAKSMDFALWFKFEYISSTETTINVTVPSAFIRDQQKRFGYISLIEEKLLELLGIDISVNVEIKPLSAKAAKTASVQQSRPQEPIRTEEHIEEKKDFQQFIQKDAEPVIQKEEPVEPVKPVVNRVKPFEAKNTVEERIKQQELYLNKIAPEDARHPTLRPEYTLETFVTSEQTAFVYNAACAITKNPGKAYNPALIYGGVGLGKTHIMQAIGNEIFKTTHARVIYVTAESFTNEFIQAIQNKTTNQFKNKYRSADVLLIDDIHFLQKKWETQEELFHTFNALYESNKQMIFTCDRPLSELKDMAERLVSRFGKGLDIDMKTPNYETRRAILTKKTEYSNVKIPMDVIDFIAESISTNVRDLEAALTKLIAYSELIHRDITLDIAKQQLKNSYGIEKAAESITVEMIQKIVSDHFGISIAELKGKKRTKSILFPRQLAMYIARETTEFSTTEIGMEFSGKEHTTVMHACKKIEEKLTVDPSLNNTIQALIQKLGVPNK